MSKFIDIHIHGAYGINFNYATYEEIKKVLKNLYQKNIKAICPTLVGDNAINIQQQLVVFSEIKKSQTDDVASETYVIGVHLEGSFLSPFKGGIQNRDNFLKPTVENFKNLVGQYENIVKIVTIAPEEDVDLIEYLNNKNIITQAGHTCSGFLKKCKGITHLFNAMNSIHHRDKTVALSALLDDEIFCEIIADYKHLSEDAIKLVLKNKPLDKILLVSDCLPCAYYEDSVLFCDKKINTFGMDENGTIAGSVMTLDMICKQLMDNGLFSKEEIEKTAFQNQIDYLKLSNIEIDILNR